MKKIQFKALHNGKTYFVSTLGLDKNGIKPGMTFAHHEGNEELIEEKSCISFNSDTRFMQLTGEITFEEVE